jgi:hypothetical protein
MAGQFLGFVPLGNTLVGQCITTSTTNVPTNADSTPTVRTYGPSGNVTAGNVNASTLDQANVPGLYSFSIVASAGNGFAAGSLYTVVVKYAVSANNKSDTYTFIVV